MSGGSAVKTAVGRGGSPVLAATIGSERRGNAPRRPQGLALTARGPQAPKRNERKSAERLADSSCARDRRRMAETLVSGSGSVAFAMRVEPGPTLVERAQGALGGDFILRLNNRGRFTIPSRQAQSEPLPAIVGELRHGLDEILLMRLAQCKPVKPSQSAQLVEPSRLSRLRKDNKKSINLFIRTRPPRASSRCIMTKFMFGVTSEDRPRARLLTSLIKSSLPQLFSQCRADGKPAETLNPSFALFKIERARAQIPVQELTAPDVKVQTFLSE